MSEVKYNFNIKPTRQAQILADKLSLTESQLSQLVENYVADAFTVSGMESTELLDLVKDSIAQSMLEGDTERDWEKQVAPKLEAKGFLPENPYHLRTTFYQNMYNSYSAGKYEMAMKPFVREQFPWFRYSKVLEVACEICEPLEDFEADKDDPIWDSIYPPNHFLCACEIQSIEAPDDGEADDISDLQEWPGVQDGFDHPPTDSLSDEVEE